MKRASIRRTDGAVVVAGKVVGYAYHWASAWWLSDDEGDMVDIATIILTRVYLSRCTPAARGAACESLRHRGHGQGGDVMDLLRCMELILENPEEYEQLVIDRAYALVKEQRATCPNCEGRGEVTDALLPGGAGPRYECETCGGTGKVAEVIDKEIPW